MSVSVSVSNLISLYVRVNEMFRRFSLECQFPKQIKIKNQQNLEKCQLTDELDYKTR